MENIKTPPHSPRRPGGRNIYAAPLSPRLVSARQFSQYMSTLSGGRKDETESLTMNIGTIANTLSTGAENEITLILFEMQQVFHFCREYAERTLIPIICAKATEWGSSLQLSAGEALVSVSVSNVPSHLAKTISSTASDIIRSTNDSSVREVWGHILVTTLPHVTWSADELSVFIDELEDGWASYKNLHARVLGSLAISSHDENIKTRIMRKAIHICKDQDLEVRGMIAESLATIGAALKVSVVEKELWPCLLNLLKDNNARIHAATIRTLAHISLAHKEKTPDAKLFYDHLPPVLLDECVRIRRSASQDQRTVGDDLYLLLEIDSEVFGKLLYCCHEYLADDATKKEVLKAFSEMATCNGPIIRKNCAFNMPGVATCLAKRGRFLLSSIVEFLSRDSEPETRWRLAAGLHETIKCLAGKDTIGNLFTTVLRLLQDSNALVRMNTLRHLEKLLAQLARHSGYNSVRKLAPIFEKLHLLSEGNWRTQELLARQLRLATPLVPPPAIRSNVLPLLYSISKDSSHLVRKATMATIATCMRYLPDTTEREQVMQAFRTTWAHGPVYWMRIAFIDSAKAAHEMYSKCLFRDTYGSEVLRLSQDVVPNVRLRVALLLPDIAPACYQMEEFHNALERLQDDIDEGVVEAMSSIDERVDAAIKKSTEHFEDDMKREEEERELYAVHLNARRDAQRKSGNMKRAKTMLFGKSSRSSIPISPTGKRGPAPSEQSSKTVSHGVEQISHSLDLEPAWMMLR
ncbi:Serine/threonine-protein phosphatase 4 regulatory subunit 4 [Gracilariopsis chorda]|uniref:Serine/threonine-protein phosphatase 4 regulatory subunit 4 n=1 Tax=Gracilariopsis chorda TaxID=448386 RepID=A0A2V3J2I8_9FLOR|nr:Serine/threonine-protein phosphatase 4 regulatory subunit 4 [Gracilariopsis chorda]|eukprot:PXF48553.1 Serine/threonine-protein phosphatase 4 regulatory subunit 4 [Gracilariopsis chorda]